MNENIVANVDSATEHTSFRTFVVVWLGQLVSVTGTTLTGFGLQLFVFSETRSVTRLTFVALSFAVPAIVLAPLAGSVIDRFDRRTVMLVSDLVAGAATLGLFLVYATDSLELWHIYLATAVGASANTFQEPAWIASISVLVPKAQLGRANGLVQLNQGLSIVLAPAIAGALLATVGLGAVLLVDAATFAVGIGTLLVSRFPGFVREEGPRRSTLADARFAWGFLRERSGLFGLLWIYAGVNFMLSISNVLIIPLVVSFASEAAAGAVLSAAGLGAVAGSVLVGVFGVPKQLIRTILLGIFISGFVLALEGTRASLPVIGSTAVVLLLINPIVNAASQTVWQTKVAEGVQGRVFSLRRMIGSAISPLAIFLAGPLTDKVFEPLLDVDGALAGSVGAAIGTGPGRGIGFLYIVAGIGTVALAVIGWARPRIRNLESELPDEAGRE